MERRIVSEYKFDAGRTSAETLALAEASKAQLLAPEPLTQERRLVIIASWARALGDALGCFDEATGKLASSQIYGAKEVLITGADTHNAPSGRSIDAEHAGKSLSASFASDLESLITESGIPLWIHGHTHNNVDYHVGATRIYTNQRGYPDKVLAGFDPGAVIEL